MKKLFTLIGTVLLSMSVNAQTKTTFKILPFTIAPGESKTITLDLDNPDLEVGSARVDILLPEGIEIEDEEGEYYLDYNAEAGRAKRTFNDPMAAKQADGALRVVMFSKGTKAFAGTSGAILDLPIKASETLATGKGEVKVYNQEITNLSGTVKINPEAYTSEVTIEATGVKEVNANDAANGDGKYIKNGQIIIKKGNKEYNAVGGIMK